MISAAQCRMARAGLQWKIKQLAAKAGISAPTIVRFENGQAAPMPATLKVIKLAFEDAGIEFLGYDGLRLKRESS
jgi:transcriptional regulator with XRE-family HTH domain